MSSYEEIVLQDGVRSYVLLSASRAREISKEHLRPISSRVAMGILRRCLFDAGADLVRISRVANSLLSWSPHHSGGDIDRAHILDRLEDVLERGHWVLIEQADPALVARSAPLSSSETHASEVPVVSLSDLDRAEERHWIEVQIVDQQGSPVSGVSYEITLTDGQIRRGRSDHEGLLRFEGIPSGSCEFHLRETDGDAWRLSA